MPEEKSKSIALPEPEVERIESLVRSGAYASAGDVVHEALLALDDRNQWIREEVLPVYEKFQADPSRAVPAEEVFERLRAHHARRVLEERQKSA
jgi:antitoxin ParD1/3/4